LKRRTASEVGSLFFSLEQLEATKALLENGVNDFTTGDDAPRGSEGGAWCAMVQPASRYALKVWFLFFFSLCFDSAQVAERRVSVYTGLHELCSAKRITTEMNTKGVMPKDPMLLFPLPPLPPLLFCFFLWFVCFPVRFRSLFFCLVVF